nr:uncharacterized protein LOC112022124 [Quercus suber]
MSVSVHHSLQSKLYLDHYDNEDPASQVSVEVNSAQDLHLTMDNKKTKLPFQFTVVAKHQDVLRNHMKNIRTGLVFLIPQTQLMFIKNLFLSIYTKEHMTFWGHKALVLFSAWLGMCLAMYTLAMTFICVIATLVKWLSYVKNLGMNNVLVGLMHMTMYMVFCGLAYIRDAVMTFDGVFFL